MIKEKIVNKVGLITLDRPKKINALNIETIRAIKETLEKWKDNDNVRLILFESESDKGFCAGGDLRQMYEEFINNEACLEKDLFFVEEFDLDKYVARYKKPIVSHWFGVVMGGGIGLSINSDFIITDETLNWAMPETILGFVPDVGACKFISKLPQALGQYVGLLGASLGTYDVMKYGFADVSIKADDYEKIRDKLFDLSLSYEGDELIEKFRDEALDYESQPEKSFVSENIEKIEKYFSGSSVDDIKENLRANEDDEFAAKCLAELDKRFAFMLDVQFEKYFLCKDMTYEEVVDLDLEIMRYSIEIGSALEGIRAKMIDKDGKPNWPDLGDKKEQEEKLKALLGVEKVYAEKI